VDLFLLACAEDLEGIVAKPRDSRYDAKARRPAWLKIKNPTYSQADDRGELFTGRRMTEIKGRR
jgi:ATP-dependent DNA ligase